MITRILFTLGLLLSVCAGFCHLFIVDEIDYTNAYMKFTALSSLFILATVVSLAKDKYVKYVAEAALVLAFSQVLDEFFFNPTELGVNESVLFILAVLWLLHRLKFIQLTRSGQS